jgi:hypothetical protein
LPNLDHAASVDLQKVQLRRVAGKSLCRFSFVMVVNGYGATSRMCRYNLRLKCTRQLRTGGKPCSASSSHRRQ